MARHRTLFSFLIALLSLAQTANGQLKVLSAGDATQQWKNSQLQLIQQQLQDSSIKGPLRDELAAQQRWLNEWNSGKLTDQHWMTQSSKNKLFTEPTIDPEKKAKKLRDRLLGKSAKPTSKDTSELQELLGKSPGDVGLKQLYLHWLDQRQYRDEYVAPIVETATSLAGQLEREKQTEEIKLVRAYCYYRAARALIHRESEESVAKKPIEDPEKHEAQLLGIYAQLCQLVGHSRPEFILLEIRMLRRDNWFGRALILLEENAEVIEPEWYLNNRRDLLKDLGWNQPAKEADQIAVNYKGNRDSQIRSASRPNDD